MASKLVIPKPGGAEVVGMAIVAGVALVPAGDPFTKKENADTTATRIGEIMTTTMPVGGLAVRRYTGMPLSKFRSVLSIRY
jgi:hypothetical protein